MFVVKDKKHGEQIGEFATREEAVALLVALSRMRWDERPNVAPCADWQTCGRAYELLEFDRTAEPPRLVNETAALEISAEGIRWLSIEIFQSEPIQESPDMEPQLAQASIA